MAYELRIDGRAAGRFEQSEDAVEAVKRLLQQRPDCEPEIFDLETGKPFAPAASRGWREHLANMVGF